MADTRETALIFWTEKRDGYFHIYGTVGYVGPTLDAPEYASRYTSDRKDGLLFSGLQITSQGNDADYHGNTTDRKLYGFGLEYRNVFSVDLRDALGMAKTLKTLTTRMEKLHDVQGYPRTFPQFVGQVAQAVKATRFFFRNANHAYDVRHSIRDGMARVEGLEREWQRAGQPEEAAS